MPVGDAQPPTDDPLIGMVLSERYRIIRKIGEGGMGCVYQAEHALIEKKVGAKLGINDRAGMEYAGSGDPTQGRHPDRRVPPP